MARSTFTGDDVPSRFGGPDVTGLSIAAATRAAARKSFLIFLKKHVQAQTTALQPAIFSWTVAGNRPEGTLQKPGANARRKASCSKGGDAGKKWFFELRATPAVYHGTPPPGGAPGAAHFRPPRLATAPTTAEGTGQTLAPGPALSATRPRAPLQGQNTPQEVVVGSDGS